MAAPGRERGPGGGHVPSSAPLPPPQVVSGGGPGTHPDADTRGHLRSGPPEGSKQQRAVTGTVWHTRAPPLAGHTQTRTAMILPQVHLRKPCYDFYFLQTARFDLPLAAGGTRPNGRAPRAIRRPHRVVQSVVATGGVYKGQGRNQRELMTRAY